jgi:major type 1 subunit fimbrin (pilin)
MDIIMKKFSLAFIAMAVIAASGGAFAEEPVTPPKPVPVKGGSGKISFTGVINNDACSVDGSNADRVISVDMGNVSIKDMGTAESPTSGRVTGKDINLNVNCNLGTKVAMIFDAVGGGSGLVTGKKVLALTKGTGTAANVGIALIDSNGELIDLSSKTTARIQSDMHGTGTAGGDTTLSFSAAYVTTAEAGKSTAGRGDATLPFILEYE